MGSIDEKLQVKISWDCLLNGQSHEIFDRYLGLKYLTLAPYEQFRELFRFREDIPEKRVPA